MKSLLAILCTISSFHLLAQVYTPSLLFPDKLNVSRTNEHQRIQDTKIFVKIPDDYKYLIPDDRGTGISSKNAELYPKLSNSPSK